MTDRQRLALRCLLALGCLMVFWAIVGPIASGLAIADVLQEQRLIEADKIVDVASVYEDSLGRGRILTATMGMAIAALSAFGLWPKRKIP